MKKMCLCLVVVAAVLLVPVLQPVAVCSAECSVPAALPTTVEIEPIRDTISRILTPRVVSLIRRIVGEAMGGEGALTDVLNKVLPLVVNVLRMLLPVLTLLLSCIGFLLGFCVFIPCIGPAIDAWSQSFKASNRVQF